MPPAASGVDQERLTVLFAVDRALTDPRRTGSAESNLVSAAIIKDRIARTDRCESQRLAHFSTPLVTQLIFAIRAPKRHPDIVRFVHGPFGACTLRRPVSLSRIGLCIVASFSACPTYRANGMGRRCRIQKDPNHGDPAGLILGDWLNTSRTMSAKALSHGIPGDRWRVSLMRCIRSFGSATDFAIFWIFGRIFRRASSARTCSMMRRAWRSTVGI